MGTFATATSTATPWRVDLTDGVHRWHADEPAADGGADTGPSPAQMICGALAACTTITIQMYAARKKWPVAAVEVTVTRNARGKPEDGATELDRQIRLTGTLDDEQRKRLLDVANKCPTHKLLSGPIRIATQLA
ncbi:MAG: OsmC family protein [Nevskiaceae bacterium]